MACGLPVIASNVCDNPRILCNEVCGYLVNPYSAENMADAMKKMMELSPEERINMGRLARNHIETAFSSDNFINAYIKLIEGVIE